MSSRPLFTPKTVINAVSMASTITSDVSIVTNVSMMSYSYVWTGSSPVGSISVEVSNDYSINSDGTVRNAGNWTALELSATTDIAGNSGAGFIDIDALSANAIRTKYTKVSGTGTLTAIFKAKVA